MKTLRIGLIGYGSMGRYHATNLFSGKVPRAALVAVADSDADFSALPEGVKGYRDAGEMICAGAVDAVIIATPHYSHTSLGIYALEKGLHVLVEKPISVHKADAERLIAAHTNPAQVFAAVFNVRTDPTYIRLRELIRKGELGEIFRINWIVTTWFRNEAYYKSGSWRATWEGEGGGVLLNQCPHQLDLLQWLFGMPARLRSHCRFGRRHQIEVEDEVTTWMEFANGASGVFVTSTGEYPGSDRLEIACDRGTVVLENNTVRWKRTEETVTHKLLHGVSASDIPRHWDVEVPVKGAATSHLGIVVNFVEAILDRAPLIAPAAEGIHSVELANAMLLSQFLDKTIELPMDGAVYEAELQKRIEESRARKV